MIALGQRRDPVRLFWRRLMILGLFFLVLFGLSAVWGVYWKEHESRVLRLQAEARLNDLHERKTALSASIASLDTEAGKERALRGVYEVGKEGERLVVIVDEPEAEPMPGSTTPRTWFQRVFGR
jgi:cell division protein FtsB